MSSPGRIAATHPQDRDRSLPYLPALDGVRAFAVAAVAMFHAGFVGSGWIGVQIFFVLSGFLITSILLKDTRASLADYLKRFYRRRALRIFPLYFLFLGIVAAASLVYGVTTAFRQQWPYLLTYTFNFARILDDYEYPRFWGHLWSLSIEEQFYLFWPLLVFFVPARRFRWLCWAVILASPVLRWIVEAAWLASGASDGHTGHVIYNLTFCQVDAFASGALLAGRETTARRPFARPALVLLAATIVTFGAGVANMRLTGGDSSLLTAGYPLNLPTGHQSVWGYTLLNFWSASVLAVLLANGAAARVLSWAPFRAVGRISYGVYVWHLPVLVLLRGFAHWPIGARTPAGGLALLGYLAITFAVSLASYELIEKRFLALKDRTRLRRAA
jgi:peptidoglycan/LPS O-acetylase OafA/YrhL